MESQYVYCCVGIAKFLMGCCKVIPEVDLRLLDDGSSHPFYDNAAKDVMFRNNDKAQIHYLSWRKWAS